LIQATIIATIAPAAAASEVFMTISETVYGSPRLSVDPALKPNHPSQRMNRAYPVVAHTHYI
jgi:hypothetical protein